MIRATLVVATLALLASGFSMSAARAEHRYKILSFDDLSGWAGDDHSAAFDVFRVTCADIKGPEWSAICAYASSRPDPRSFFEMLFLPVLIGGDQEALFTGYFEPELKGARQKSAIYQYPIYALPPDMPADEPWFTRAEIEEGGVISDPSLVLAWLDDPVDAFFLQVQGSGRIALTDGDAMRVGYAGKNGHEYVSIGQELVRRGVFDAHQVSAPVIRNWVRENPDEGRALLQVNPSFVFFREVSEVPPEKGPLGAMNRSISTLRSIAVDPEFTPLGAPVWIEKGGSDPLKRLMIAQDTGSAIRGAQRADVFYGTGEDAGREAGRIKDPGRMVVLLPVQIAYALAAES